MAQRIYTRIVMTWDFEILESESFLYEGPVDLKQIEIAPDMYGSQVVYFV